MNKADWVWMPHAGHFIAWRSCDFRMSTYVGGVIVSTVGEYRDSLRPDRDGEIGLGRMYETMVFEAGPSAPNVLYCPYEATSYQEIDFAPYNAANDAYEGHLAMCERWAAKDASK